MGVGLSQEHQNAPEDWAAVAAAISARKSELKMSTKRLARETGLSETTVRYIYQSGRKHKSSLVAISAVLGWRYDHLTNILRGQPQENSPTRWPLAERLSLIEAKLNTIMMQNDRLLLRPMRIRVVRK